MSYAPIDVELMRSKLLSVDDVRERLEPTEHLSEYEFMTDGTNTVHFNYPSGWNEGLKSADDLYVTDATVTIDGTELPLTKSAALEAASSFGLQKSYTLNTPGPLIADHLNYWYSHGSKSLKLLGSSSAGLGFTRGTITPFSNVALMDAAIQGIRDRYNTDDILVDYKFNHNLEKTNIRLIVPSHSREIGSARSSAAGDPWSVGLDIKNSVTGLSPLEISGYLFAWWCTNGCTTEHASSGKYRRKPSLTPDDAYDWAREVVDDVLGDLEHEFEAIEALTQIPLEGELNETLGRMFEQFQIPANARDEIINNLIESDDLTAYGLMNSITAAANNGDLTPGAVSALLTAGGQVAHVLSDRCESCHRFG